MKKEYVNSLLTYVTAVCTYGADSNFFVLLSVEITHWYTRFLRILYLTEPPKKRALFKMTIGPKADPETWSPAGHPANIHPHNDSFILHKSEHSTVQIVSETKLSKDQTGE
jgi:hypothetical protein